MVLVYVHSHNPHNTLLHGSRKSCALLAVKLVKTEFNQQTATIPPWTFPELSAIRKQWICTISKTTNKNSKVKHNSTHRCNCSPDDSGCGWSIMLGLCPGSRFPKVAGAAVGSRFAEPGGSRGGQVERSTGLRDLRGSSHHFGWGLEIQADHLSST